MEREERGREERGRVERDCGEKEGGGRERGKESAFSCSFSVWEPASCCAAQARPELSVTPLPAGMTGMRCRMWLCRVCSGLGHTPHLLLFVALPSSVGMAISISPPRVGILSPSLAPHFETGSL